MAGLRETLYSTQARRPSRSLEDTLYGPSLAVNPDDYEQAAIQNTGDFGRGLSSSLTGSVSSVQRYLGANESALANQQEAARWAPEIQTTDQVTDFGTGARYVAGALGEAAGSLPPALIGGVAGRALAGARGAYLGAAAGYQPVMAGSHMQELDANRNTAGMSESDKRWRGTGIGALQAGVEGLAPGYMINRLARPQALVKAGFGPAVGRAAGVLATDAALEGGGAAVSDVIGQGSVMQLDPTKNYDPNQTFQAGVREAVGGAGMGAVHAPLAVANDYLREGAATGGSLAARGARAGIDAVAPAAGRAYDAAADIFKTSADFHMQHPEFAGLTTPLSMPKGMKADDTVGINAYLDAEGAKRNAAAKAMAQRMVDNPDMHSNEDLHEAQSMLNSTDPDAWDGFSKGVGRRQVRENVVDALGRFTNHVNEKFGELKDKAVGTKSNAESTGQDHEFLQSMHKSVTQAADLGDADLTMPLHALKTYVLSGMRDKDGMVDVPDELVEALGDQAPVILAKAYDTLRRQGRTGHFDAEAPALLKEAAEIVKEKQAVQQNVGKLVGDNLTPTAFDTMHHSTWENIGQAVRSYVNRGKKDARLEDALDQWFGPNKEKVIAQIAQLSQRDRLRSSSENENEDEGADALRDARDTNEDSPSDGTGTDYESQMTEKAPAVAYHFKDAENTPFDRADPFAENHMADVPVKLDTSRFVTTKDKAGTDRVRAEQIGVVDHARETGDSSVLDKLMLAHPGMSQNKLNERFRLLKTQERMPDESEDIDIKPRELLAPAERRVGGKRVLNKHSWQDVTALGEKDVSTTEFGRLYLTPGSPEHTNKETGEITPAVKEGKEFVTSAQKIITKMWARGVETGSSPQAMLEAFTTGLSSLLAAGKFHGEMQVKLPDGTMKVINGMKDLPDDFVLFRTKDKVVTVKDARESGSKAVRTERSKEQVVAKDEAGHELIFKDKKDADKAVSNKDQMVAEHGKNWAVYDNAPESTTKPGIAIDVEARRLATARERGKGETAGPIGERGEGGGRQDHHGLAESDERAVRENEKFDNTERRVDELTGLELQPRGVQSADQRVRLLDKRIDALRAEYKELNDKIKEYAGKTGVNAVREGNLKTWRGKLEVVKAKGLKLGAERTELIEYADKAATLPKSTPQVKPSKPKPTKEQLAAALKVEEARFGKYLADKEARAMLGAEQSADNTSALRKIQEARAKARAEKADPKIETNYVSFNKEKTGMSDNRPTNDVEAIDLLYKLLGKDIDAAFTSAGALDGSGTWRRDPKTGKAVIRIAIDALDPTSIAYHESMHEFMQRLLDDKHSRASKVLQDAANSDPVLRQMERHFASEPAVLKQLAEDPAERVAYMFQLWAAGKVHVGPQTETVFRKIISLIRKVLGLATNDKNALEIMQNFAVGQMSDRGAIARVLDTQESRGAYLRKVGTIMKPVVERGAEIVGFAENILADSGNPALVSLGKLFHNKTGTQDEGQGYLSAETQAQNKYMNKFAEALRHGDKEDVRLTMEGLQKKEDHADPIVRKIQEGVKAVFREMYTYMADAGVMRWDEKAGEKGQWVPVKTIDDYRLPVSWDASEIIANSEKFKNLLFEHHAKELAAIAKNANKEVADRKGAGRYTASQEKLANPDGKEITAENVADALVQRLISTNGQVEFQENENALGFSPFMKSVNERSLHWIDQSVFHEFQEKDMALILTTYVGQATKRAEYSRRFGPDGGILQDKMEQAWEFEIDKLMLEKYKIEGAVAKARGAKVPRINKDGSIEADAAKGLPAPADDLASQLSALAEGVDGAEITKQATKKLEPARRAVMAMEGTLGHDISPLMRKVNAYSIVYTNVRLLGYAMFSNLIDPLGIMVRGGEMKDAYATFKRGMRDVGREWGKLTGLREEKADDRDEAVRVAEMIGTVDSSAFMSTMGNMYGSQFLGKWARDANDSFFRWNGMEAFNRAMRVGATQAAISFIKRHHEKPNKHSERYFKELNLDPKDVKIDADGRLNYEHPAVQQAVMRWVDGAQLRPNAAIRPTMASDPHYATFYHLKQFMYAMQAIILKRVQVEIKNGNTDPLILLMAGYVPMMLAADAAKGLLQTATGGGAPMWEHQGVAGVVAHGVQRAGLLGVGQMAVDVAEYGPAGLGGPMVEQVASAATDPIGKTVAEAAAVGPLNMALKGTTWTNN